MLIAVRAAVGVVKNSLIDLGGVKSHKFENLMEAVSLWCIMVYNDYIKVAGKLKSLRTRMTQ